MLTFAITAVLAAAVGYLVSWLVSSRRTAELSGQIAVLSAENSRLNTAATAHGDLLGLLAPVRESLDGLQRSKFPVFIRCRFEEEQFARFTVK